MHTEFVSEKLKKAIQRQWHMWKVYIEIEYCGLELGWLFWTR